MARVTVEDCLQNVKNRFELVMVAAKRARQLMRGTSEPKVAWENDKATVVALREIAQGYTTFSDTHEVPHALPELTDNLRETAPTVLEETHHLDPDAAENLHHTPSELPTSDDAIDPEQHL